MTPNTGGPAFPGATYDGPFAGMSLRDFFAAKAMQGMNSVDQLQGFAKQIAPMGEMGLKLFQQFVEQGAGAAMAGFKAGASGDKPKS